MDTLETIFKLQGELATLLASERYPRIKEEQISALATAIVHEAVEIQRLTNWKWWKKPMEFDEVQAREEVIDLWHFLIQMSLELGMTPKDILKEYQKKHQVNIERQKNGY
jgi:dimeric dUTPase (all-alpha-NTP-PPase superfamily)